MEGVALATRTSLSCSLLTSSPSNQQTQNPFLYPFLCTEICDLLRFKDNQLLSKLKLALITRQLLAILSSPLCRCRCAFYDFPNKMNPQNRNGRFLLYPEPLQAWVQLNS